MPCPASAAVRPTTASRSSDDAARSDCVRGFSNAPPRAALRAIPRPIAVARRCSPDFVRQRSPCQSNGDDSNGLTCQDPKAKPAARRRRESRLAQAPVEPEQTTVRRCAEACSARRIRSSRCGLRLGQEVEATVRPRAGGGIIRSAPRMPEMRAHCADNHAEENLLHLRRRPARSISGAASEVITRICVSGSAAPIGPRLRSSI